MEHFIFNMKQLVIKYTNAAVIEYFYNFKTHIILKHNLHCYYNYTIKKNTCGNNYNT
jgi:hypothetical protein